MKIGDDVQYFPVSAANEFTKRRPATTSSELC